LGEDVAEESIHTGKNSKHGWRTIMIVENKMLEQARVLLQKYFGYPAFKEGQARVISSLLAGEDTLAIMPTGSGKSVCYQVPSMIFTGVTLVISPLIALMKDQVDGLGGLGIPATFINSSLRNSEVAKRLGLAGQGKYKLIYVAPERLESEAFQELVKTLDVSFVAIDEAHCVSQWGHDFRPSYRRIAQFVAGLAKRPVLGAFTATATEEVKKDIVTLLSLREPKLYVTGFDRKNLFFSVVRGANKKDFVLDYLKNSGQKSGIIYAATRKEVDTLYETLSGKGYRCGRYHAGMSDKERERSQESFIYDDLPVMVATNAFGMGIDKSNVRYVIHYNMTKNMEAYYQEAGRAGRDGEPGECIILFGPQDVLLQKFMIEQSVYSPARKKNEYHKLQTMVDYCHTPRCLRKFILEYFGEEGIFEQCGNCGSCNDDSDLVDITIEAQKIISCVVRMRERFGAGLVAEVLKGTKNKKILQLRFDSLSTYGLMKEYSLQEIKDLINLLNAEGYLYFTEGKFPVVKAGRNAAAVLKQGEKVFQKKRKAKKAERDDSLFEFLRIARKNIAERDKVPPYLVFTDASLREMSETQPGDRQEMLGIKGVGEAKLEKYGEEFLRVIKEYAAAKPERN